MNLAVSALGIFLLVLPGVLFRRAFLRGPRGFPVAPRALPDEVAISAVAAALLHGVWGWLVQHAAVTWLSWHELQSDFRAAGLLIVGHFGDKDALLEPALTRMTGHAWHFIGYFFGLYVFSVGMGFGSHWSATRIKWLRNSWFFGFNSRWHQLIDGQLYFKGTNTQPRGPVYCIVSAVVELGGDTYLYQGLIVDADDLSFDSNGALEDLTLRGVRRRKLSEDRTPENGDRERFYAIDGDLFVLRYAHAKTVNFNYVALRPTPTAAPRQPEHERSAHLP